MLNIITPCETLVGGGTVTGMFVYIVLFKLTVVKGLLGTERVEVGWVEDVSDEEW